MSYDLNVIASVNVAEALPKDCLWTLWQVVEYRTTPGTLTQAFYVCESFEHCVALRNLLRMRELTSNQTKYDSFECLHRADVARDWHKQELPV